MMQTLLHNVCNDAVDYASLQNHVQDNGSVWRTSYEITCSAPSAGDNQLPVFLAQPPDEGNTGRQYIVLAQGTYTQSPGGGVLPEADVFPLLGPMGGGTEVMLQVSSKTAPPSLTHQLELTRSLMLALLLRFPLLGHMGGGTGDEATFCQFRQCRDCHPVASSSAGGAK